MRYIIGARIPNNDGEIIEGLYIVNKYGLPWILNNKKILKEALPQLTTLLCI